MEEVIIYKFQLEVIQNALRLTKNIFVDVDKEHGESCFDRQVKEAKLYAENALEGNKDKRVSYFGNK